jgi:hypothetical protein
MKLILRDLIILTIIFALWFIYFTLTQCPPMHEALKYFPMHFIISIGYYAIVRVCYNMLNIKDCTEEYNTLIKEIDEARDYYTKKGVKYN